MEQRVPQQIFDKFNDLKLKILPVFFRGIIKLVSQNYQECGIRLSNSYKRTLASKALAISDQRLKTTCATQTAIAEFVAWVMLAHEILPKEVSDIQKTLHSEIISVCFRQDELLQQKKNVCSSYTYPKIMMDIITNIGNGCDIVYSEDSYLRHFEKKGLKIMGFCVRDGIFSFKRKRLFESIGKVDPMKTFQEELGKFGLLIVDSEGKSCCRYGTRQRYYHVDVKKLLYLFEDEFLDALLMKAVVLERFTAKD